MSLVARKCYDISTINENTAKTSSIYRNDLKPGLLSGNVKKVKPQGSKQFFSNLTVFQFGCQYSDCYINRGGFYGSNCGLRMGYRNLYDYNNGFMKRNSLCMATRGWPGSYCQNSWNNVKTPFCDTSLCSFDCQSYGQDGGYCEKNKCLCFLQVIKPKIEEFAIADPEKSD